MTRTDIADGTPPVFGRLTALLDAGDVPYTVLDHPRACTADEVARVEHVRPHDIAKVVVVRTGGGYHMVVLPGPHRVDVHRVARGRDVRLATETELEALFPGCDLGAMPPFGQLFGLPIHADECLARDEHIVFNAGSHSRAIRMRYADWARLATPIVDDYTRLPGDE